MIYTITSNAIRFSNNLQMDLVITIYIGKESICEQ